MTVLVHGSDKEIPLYSTRYAPSCTSYFGEASRRGTAVNTMGDPHLTEEAGRRSYVRCGEHPE